MSMPAEVHPLTPGKVLKHSQELVSSHAAAKVRIPKQSHQPLPQRIEESLLLGTGTIFSFLRKVAAEVFP